MSASACEEWEFYEIRILTKHLIRDVRAIAKDMEEKSKVFKEYADRIEEAVKGKLGLQRIHLAAVLLEGDLYDVLEAVDRAYEDARKISERCDCMIMRGCEEGGGGN